MGNIQKRKLLFYYMKGGTAGGSDTCLFLLLKYLNKEKYNIYLIFNEESKLVSELKELGINLYHISDPKWYKKQNKKFSVKTKKKPKKIRKLLGSFRKTVKLLPQTFQYVKIIKKLNVDLVHVNHYLAGDRSMILAATLTGKKIVSHNRGLYPPDIIDKILVKNIDKIICISNFSKSVYTENGISEKKCKTIYDGIEIEENIKITETESPFIIGCFGRLESWKGQEILIDAVEIIIQKKHNFKVQIIGNGPSEDKLKLKVKEMNLEPFIEFTGHVTNVKEYMCACAMVVHTSIEPEPFGMVITEAMALGKPVIATNFGGPTEIITDGEDGFLIPAKNPQFLADKILMLLKDSNLRSQIGKRAFEKVKTKFDVKNSALNIEEEYHKILG